LAAWMTGAFRGIAGIGELSRGALLEALQRALGTVAFSLVHIAWEAHGFLGDAAHSRRWYGTEVVTRKELLRWVSNDGRIVSLSGELHLSRGPLERAGCRWADGRPE
jgi:hypothetical protein